MSERPANCPRSDSMLATSPPSPPVRSRWALSRPRIPSRTNTWEGREWSQEVKNWMLLSIRGVTIPLFNGSVSGFGIAKRLKILLRIWIKVWNHNTSTGVKNLLFTGFESRYGITKKFQIWLKIRIHGWYHNTPNTWIIEPWFRAWPLWGAPSWAWWAPAWHLWRSRRNRASPGRVVGRRRSWARFRRWRRRRSWTRLCRRPPSNRGQASHDKTRRTSQRKTKKCLTIVLCTLFKKGHL